MKKTQLALLILVMLASVFLSACNRDAYFIFTEDYMAALGQRAVSGDLTAIDKIEDEYRRLYKGIDYMEGPLPGKTMGRSTKNLVLMQAAFDPIGGAAGRGSEQAMEALRYATKKESIRGFVPHALGIAAASGNQDALDMLVHYGKHGFLESSTIFALEPAAKTNIAEAVQFMLDSLADPSDRSIHHVAISALTGAARVGNARAKEAVVGHVSRTLETKPTARGFQALAAIDQATARNAAMRLFGNPGTIRSDKYWLGQFLLRTEMPKAGRRMGDPPGFVAEYRAFLIDAILVSGEEEFLTQKEYGSRTAVGEYCRLATGERGGPETVLFTELKDPRVIPVLEQCLNAPAYEGSLWKRYPVNLERNTIPLALARLQAVQTIPVLQEITRTHGDPNFRKAALFALDVLVPLEEARKNSANK